MGSALRKTLWNMTFGFAVIDSARTARKILFKKAPLNPQFSHWLNIGSNWSIKLWGERFWRQRLKDYTITSNGTNRIDIVLIRVMFVPFPTRSPAGIDANHSKMRIRNGSFVLIDVESWCFVCLILRVFNQLLLWFRRAFHQSGSYTIACAFWIPREFWRGSAAVLWTPPGSTVDESRANEENSKTSLFTADRFSINEPTVDFVVVSFHQLAIEVCLRSRTIPLVLLRA